MTQFQGFEFPDSNYFRLPNSWIDITYKMSLAEMKVIQYVLRHTWGWRNQKMCKITLKEFEEGRKHPDGRSIDKGTGLDRNSIRTGLRLAVDHGYLVRTEHGEKGRERHFYGPKMQGEFLGDPGGKIPNAGGKNSQCRGEKLPPVSPPPLSHTPKEKERKRKKVRGKAAAPPEGLLFDKFDGIAAGHLRALLMQQDSDLVNGPKQARISTFTKSITNLRTDRNIPKKEIQVMIKWLRENYKDKYTPKVKRADDLYARWGIFRDARLRWLEDNDGAAPSFNSESSEVTAMDVYEQLQMLGTAIDYDQGDIDLAAGMLGLDEGVFSVEDMPG